MNAAQALKQLNSAIRQLENTRRLLEQGVPQLPPDAEGRLAAGRCLGCNKVLGDELAKRGNCAACYKAVRDAINNPNDDMTDDDAIRQGLLAPRTRAGRRKQSTRNTKLQEVREAKQGYDTPADREIRKAQTEKGKEASRNRRTGKR